MMEWENAYTHHRLLKYYSKNLTTIYLPDLLSKGDSYYCKRMDQLDYLHFSKYEYVIYW